MGGVDREEGMQSGDYVGDVSWIFSVRFLMYDRRMRESEDGLTKVCGT